MEPGSASSLVKIMSYKISKEDWEGRNPNNPDECKSNYCWCQNCNGGHPVRLPQVGEEFFSTGLYRKPAHQKGRTLFLIKDQLGFKAWTSRLYGVWLLGKYEAEQNQEEILDYGESTTKQSLVR